MTWRIGELLVQKKLISWKQLEECLTEQERTREILGEILIRKGYISRMLFYKALADQFRIRFVDLSRVKINIKAVEVLPRSFAEKYLLMPIDILEDCLLIAVGNPVSTWPQDEIKKLTHFEHIKTVLSLPDKINEVIREFYGKPKPA